MPEIQIVPTKEGVGAEVLSVDLSRELSDSHWEAIQGAFRDYGVIFFRDQELTPEQHLAFARRWGPINVNRFFSPVEGYPEIAEVLKEPDQTINIGGAWHTDHSYDQEPALGSILVARDLPENGGDTLFADMYKAFEALSDGLKETLRSLNAVHSSRHIFGDTGAYAETEDDLKGRIGNADAAQQDAVHPVVIKHPLSGREALYVNMAFTLRFEGWTAEESAPLLQFLYQHASQDQFSTRFVWKPGSIAFWDNRATWHNAMNDYHGQRRLMHRVTIEGGPLVG